MLEKMKLAVRIKSNSFDTQIKNYISYVKQDLYDIGVLYYDECNPRIVHLTELYCKSMFNYENKGEWYNTQYLKLRDQMSMQGDYTGECDE